MSDDYGAMVTGNVHSICVGRRGVEINVTSNEIRAVVEKDRPYFTCRIDRSSAYTSLMVENAMAAMTHGLSVTLIGTDRNEGDDKVKFHELRILAAT